MEIVPKAAMRRLAVDAGIKRCSTVRCDEEAQALVELVGEVVERASSAASATGRKTISREHVEHALRVVGCPLPQEVKKLTDSELRRLHRCNARSPPESRKASALSVEIPEATFGRIVARSLKEDARMSAAARRVLHATAEDRATKRFRGEDQGSPEPSGRTLPGVARALVAQGVGAQEAQATSESLERLATSLDELTSISRCATVSSAHASEALACAALGSPPPVVRNLELVHAVIARALRGRLPDKRFGKGVLPLLCSALAVGAAEER